MNDPIERAFQRLRETEVPAGPSEQLIQATLRSVGAETSRTNTLRRIRRRTMYAAVAAAAVLAVGVTWFTFRNPGSRNNHRESVIQPPPAAADLAVAGAFIESDQLEAGQTFLLPLHGAPVRVDPNTWPDDLLTITSFSDLEP